MLSLVWSEHCADADIVEKLCERTSVRWSLSWQGPRCTNPHLLLIVSGLRPIFLYESFLWLCDKHGFTT
jgi:hypothetical protein